MMKIKNFSLVRTLFVCALLLTTAFSAGAIDVGEKVVVDISSENGKCLKIGDKKYDPAIFTSGEKYENYPAVYSRWEAYYSPTVHILSQHYAWNNLHSLKGVEMNAMFFDYPQATVTGNAANTVTLWTGYSNNVIDDNRMNFFIYAPKGYVVDKVYLKGKVSSASTHDIIITMHDSVGSKKGRLYETTWKSGASEESVWETADDLGRDYVVLNLDAQTNDAIVFSKFQVTLRKTEVWADAIALPPQSLSESATTSASPYKAGYAHRQVCVAFRNVATGEYLVATSRHNNYKGGVKMSREKTSGAVWYVDNGQSVTTANDHTYGWLFNINTLDSIPSPHGGGYDYLQKNLTFDGFIQNSSTREKVVNGADYTTAENNEKRITWYFKQVPEGDEGRGGIAISYSSDFSSGNLEVSKTDNKTPFTGTDDAATDNYALWRIERIEIDPYLQDLRNQLVNIRDNWDDIYAAASEDEGEMFGLNTDDYTEEQLKNLVTRGIWSYNSYNYHTEKLSAYRFVWENYQGALRYPASFDENNPVYYEITNYGLPEQYLTQSTYNGLPIGSADVPEYAAWLKMWKLYQVGDAYMLQNAMTDLYLTQNADGSYTMTEGSGTAFEIYPQDNGVLGTFAFGDPHVTTDADAYKAHLSASTLNGYDVDSSVNDNDETNWKMKAVKDFSNIVDDLKDHINDHDDQAGFPDDESKADDGDVKKALDDLENEPSLDNYNQLLDEVKNNAIAFDKGYYRLINKKTGKTLMPSGSGFATLDIEDAKVDTVRNVWRLFWDEDLEAYTLQNPYADKEIGDGTLLALKQGLPFGEFYLYSEFDDNSLLAVNASGVADMREVATSEALWYLEPVKQVRLSLSAISNGSDSESGNAFGSFFFPYPLQITADDRATSLAYYCTTADAKATDAKGEATLAAFDEGIVPARQAFLVRNEVASSGIVANLVYDDVEMLQTNLLRGTLKTETYGEDGFPEYDNVRVFGYKTPTDFTQVETGVAFRKAANKSTLAPFKAYLFLEDGESGEIRLFFNRTQPTTGLTSVEAVGNDAQGKCYDLQGRRVGGAAKGVYILNGKKLIK